MSRSDLYDLAISRGGPRLIPAGRTRYLMWVVLTHMLLHADVVNYCTGNARTIADALHMDAAEVQAAVDGLVAAGLVATSGRLLPGVL